MHRTSESRNAYDRGLALAPTTLALLERKAMTYLAEGDMEGARAVLKAAPKEVEPTALVAFVANSADLVWLLDEAQRDLLLRLTPSAFDDDRGTWAICLTQAYALRRDEPNVRKYAEIARAAFEEHIAAVPEDAQLHAVLGLSLAYLGRKAEAVREAGRAVELSPISRDAYLGPYIQHQLVRVYILTGENEKALDTLEPLLKVPYHLTPGWLRIDPNFDPLRQSPRFQKLSPNP
jgi:tetratricopeptide (TPR) repeat protein